MDPQYSRTAQTALDESRKDGEGKVLGRSERFVCPFSDCRTYALHMWGALRNVTVNLGGSTSSTRLPGIMPTVQISRCSACEREAIYIGGQIAYPADSDAPAPAVDLPDDLKKDFEEARTILPKSPRGSSALLRLVIQQLLPHLGATKKNIDAAIGELVSNGKIKTPIQKALDTVRVIGNESVHPGEMDLRDNRDIALALFRIINLIVETEITEPKRLDALYDSLPKSKLDGIASRDSSAAQIDISSAASN